MSIFKFFTRRQSETLTDNFVVIGSSPIQDIRKVSSEGALTANFVGNANGSTILGSEAFFQLSLTVTGVINANTSIGTFSLGRTITNSNYTVRVSNLSGVQPGAYDFYCGEKNTTNFKIYTRSALDGSENSFNAELCVEVIEYV